MAHGWKPKLIILICSAIPIVLFAAFYLSYLLENSAIQAELDKFSSRDLKKHVEAIDNLFQMDEPGIKALQKHFINRPDRFELISNHWNNLNPIFGNGFTPLAVVVSNDDLYLAELFILKGAYVCFPMWTEQVEYVKIAGKFNLDHRKINPVSIYSFVKSDSMRELLEENDTPAIRLENLKKIKQMLNSENIEQ